MNEFAVAYPYQLVRVRHGVMLVNHNDAFMGLSYVKYGEACEFEINFLSRFLTLPGAVVEVGANMGVHAVPLAAQLAEQRRQMVCFEPQPVIFQQLCANLALNGLMNVRAVNAACGAEPGQLIFELPDYSKPGNFGNVVMRSDGTPPGAAADNFVTVACTTLDDVFPGDPVALLKIDVEGYELKVLEGSAKLIKRSHPVIYIENDVVANSPALIQWLLDAGYRLWWHVTRAYNPENFFGVAENIYGNTGFFNMVCLHRETGVSFDTLPEITDPLQHPLRQPA
jgi:FkbM family methyltransferase